MAQPYQSNFGAASASAANEAQDRVAQLKSKAEDIKAKAEDAASVVAAEGKKAYAAAEQKAEDAYDATRRFVREQPVVAVGVAVTAAFAIGALWKLTQARRSEDLLDRVTNILEPQYRALRRRF